MSKPSQPQTISRVIEYSVKSTKLANEVATTFLLDRSYDNLYFIECDKLDTSEPRLIKNYVDYLKIDIPNQYVYILSIKAIDNLVDNKALSMKTKSRVVYSRARRPD